MSLFEIEGITYGFARDDQFTMDANFIAEQSVREAAKTTPEQHIEDERLSHDTGLPADLVSRNRDEVKADYAHDQSMFILQGAPALKRNIVEKPGFAERLGQDIETAGALEHKLRRTKDVFKYALNNTRRTIANQEINRYFYYELNGGELTVEQIEARDSLISDEALRPNYHDQGEIYSIPSKVLYHTVGSTVPDLLAGYYHSLVKTYYPAAGFMEGFAIGATTGAVGGSVSPDPATTVAGALVVGIPTGIRGLFVGVSLGQAEFNFQQESASAFRTYSAILDDDGVPIDRDAARMAAYVSGALSAGLEHMGLDGMVTGEMRKLLTRDALDAAMRNPTVRRAFARAAGKIAQGAVREGYTEALQSLTQNVAVHAAVTQATVGEARVADDWWNDFTYSVEAGIFGGAGVSATTSTPGLYLDIQEARQTENFVNALRDIHQTAAGFNLSQRDPDGSRELIRDILEDAGVPDKVYIDREKLSVFFQSELDAPPEVRRSLTPEQMQQLMPATYDSWLESESTGAKVAIDSSELYAEMARDPRFQGIEGDLSMRPDAPTLNELREGADVSRQLLVEQERIRADLNGPEKTSDSRVANQVADQLIETGLYPPEAARHMASVMGAQMETMAAKLPDTDAWTLFNRLNLDIKGEVAALDQSSTGRTGRTGRIDSMLNILRESGVPKEDTFRGESLGQFIAREGGLADEGGEITSRDWHKRQAGMPWLGRTDGMTLETAYERARDSGYMPADQSPFELLALLDAEMNEGQPTFTEAGQTATSPDQRAAEQLYDEMNRLAQYLDDNELSVHDFDNATIKDMLGVQTLLQVAKGEPLSGRAAVELAASAAYESHNLVLSQKARGELAFPADRSFFTMMLTGKADRSTFLHESMHFMLESYNLLAAESPEIAGDLQVILDWMGAGSFDQVTVKQHEQMATAFEAYLFHGDVPRADLRETFGRVRLWMRKVYTSLRQILDQHGARLSEDITGVFDRMLASEQQIKDARAGAGLVGVFRTREESGLDHDAWMAYRDNYDEAVSRSEARLEKELMRDAAIAYTADARARKKAIRQEVTENVMAEAPGVGVKYIFKNKKLQDGSEPPHKAARLDSAAVRAIFPHPEQYRRLTYLVQKEGGVNPDDAAMAYGFDSGQAMLEAMINSPTWGDYIKNETDRRFHEEYPDGMKDGRIVDMAYEALHAEGRVSKFLLTELRALNERVGGPTATLARTYRDAARLQIEGLPLREINPGLYLRAEKQWAKEAQVATAQGDFATARDAKRRQLINHHMHRYAREAQKQSDKIRKQLKRYQTNKVRAKIGMAGTPDGEGGSHYLNLIDALMAETSLLPMGNRALDRRDAVRAWLEQVEDREGREAALPLRLQEQVQLTNWRDMTLAELTELRDGAKHIEHMARTKRELKLGRERKNRAKLVDDLVQQMADRPVRDVGPREGNAPWTMKLRDLGTGIHAALAKVEFVARKIDNDEIGGLAHQAIFQPMRDAQANAQDMQLAVTKKIEGILDFDAADNRRLGQQVTIGNTTISKRGLISVALNMGNNSNMNKMLTGEGKREGGTPWTQSMVMDSLEQHLTKRDMERVQAIWDLLNAELWPGIRDTHQAATGLPPPKIESRPLTVHGVTYDGGYYPMVYDPMLSQKAADIDSAKNDAKLFENNLMSAKGSVSNGFTEARVDAAAYPVKLDIGVLTQHVRESIHFINHYEAVTNVDILTRQPKFKQAVTNAFGAEVYQLFRPWLKNIANDGVAPPELAVVENALRHVRSGISVVAMGLSLSTAIMQGFGVFGTAAEVGVGRTAGGIGNFMRPDRRRFVAENSLEYRHLMSNMDRDVRQALLVLDAKRTDTPVQRLIYAVQSWSFVPMGLAVKAVSGSAWLSFYGRAIDQGDGHDAAVRIADAGMSMTQSLAAPKDLAKIQSAGGELQKQFTMFYTYFSTLYNQEARVRDIFRGAGGGFNGYMHATGFLTYLLIIPSVLDTFMRDGAPEDEEDWLQYGKDMALYSSASMPFIRDVGSYLVDGQYGYSDTPLEMFTKAAGRLKNQTADGELFTLESLPPVTDVASVMLRLPLAKPTDYAVRFYEWLDGNGDADADAVRTILWGEQD